MSKEDLRPNKDWVKGCPSPNPNGRPPKPKCISDILSKLGEQETPENILEQMKEMFPDIENMNIQEAALARTYICALNGESWALQFIADRTEGKVTEKIKMIYDEDIEKMTNEELAKFVLDNKNENE